ncbi:Similar to X-element\ORF2: Probable RNA-directed DNA polymerase from transposon X-element (Drosophila melanogaster) [Cotesia congregata]|uniref:Similar to X-element\ORF2: Probable RNA-directed DNA polymerase from transposon X-element (Drosophila melanogaster) n=1 Tax=Cotesia congregata TaxID=51543 RepID=A0A8J2H1E7_COTCN|nr:Similar to X-element\ORF2: Probable RNA-directed DNA polymerase from transposon X-element (Drosophila melanogaster) [Cotesia congregata]
MFPENENPAIEQPFSFKEVKNCLRRLKSGKSPGCDGIPNELLKNLPTNWILYIQAMFNRILEIGETPVCWSEVVLTMLHKKGDVNDPNNFRGIALVNCIAKVFTQLVNQRLVSWAADNNLIPEEQAGFLKGRGCQDNGASCFGLFVDFRRAFDSIPHHLLWPKLLSIGLSKKIVKILRCIYNKTTLRVRSNGDFSKPVKVTTGVLQGETLSPLLFILFISDIVSFFRDKGLTGLQLNGLRDLLMLLYADDLVILLRRQMDVLKALRALEDRFRKKLPKSFNYKNSAVEVVNSYVYLGTTVTTTATGRRAALDVVKKSNAACSVSLGILTRLHADSWAGKQKIYGAIVRTTLLYLAGIWGLEHLETIEKAQVGFFKRLLQLPRCTPGYAIRLETGVSPLAAQVFDAALRWTTRILKMDNNRLPKVCFLRLLELSNLEKQHTAANNRPRNWVSQLRSILCVLKHEHLDKLTPAVWESKRNDLVSGYTKLLQKADLERYNNSSSCQIILRQAPSYSAAKYLKRCPYYALLTSKHSSDWPPSMLAISQSTE